MTWDLGDKEFNSLLQSNGLKRYEYFIKRITDWQEIWSLRNDEGWTLGKDDEGYELVPVWPHSKYAALCSIGDWANTYPYPIKLQDWIERWIPGIKSDNRRVSVFPTADGNSIVVAPERLEADIGRQLEFYDLETLARRNPRDKGP